MRKLCVQVPAPDVTSQIVAGQPVIQALNNDRQVLKQAASGQLCATQEQHDRRPLQPVTSLHTCLTCQHRKLVPFHALQAGSDAGCARRLTVLGPPA